MLSTTLERYVTAAMILHLVAQRQGDLFGVMSFSDRVETFVRARNGQAHYRTCRDALYALQPRIVTPDFSELFSFIRLRLRRRALLVFLTSLDDPVLADAFAKDIPLISRQHLVLANMVNMPGVEPVFGGQPADSDDEIYRRLGGHFQWHRLRELARSLRRYGVTLNLIDNENLCPELVRQYLDVKRRQIL